MGEGRTPLAGEFVCFLKVPKLGGPGRRQKTVNWGGGDVDLVIGGVGSVQRPFNRSNRLGEVIVPRAF